MKLKVSIVDKTTLKLEEKGDVGDTIDLKELQSVDQTFILDAIENKKDDVYKSLLEKEILKQESSKKLALAELEKKLNEEAATLRLEKETLLLKVSSFEDRLTQERQTVKREEAAQYLIEKNSLENKITELQRTLEQQKQLTILELERNKQEELRLKQEAHTKELFEKQNEIETLKQAHYEALSELELELNNLRYTKSSLQVKMLGEELERWCNSEYEAYALTGFSNCKWYKDNIAVKNAPDEKGTKADYIFEVYVDDYKRKEEKLLSVCCEMKSESPDSKTKTKNSDHYDKLEKDRIKKNAQYALLISELEWDTVNDTPIRKIAEYENMYMVRPTYFISFLALIQSLASKYQSLLLEHKKADENFKESQEILKEFEQFKNTYLDKPLNSLLADVERIKNEANKVYESSYKIIGLTDTIISNKIAEIKVKIDRFDIKKIARKIDRLE